MTRFLLSAALLSAAALPQSARAEPDSPSVSITVAYDDLDLRRPEGRDILRKRLKSAVRQLCREELQGGVVEILGRPQCLRVATAAARRQVEVVLARADRRMSGQGALAAR